MIEDHLTGNSILKSQYLTNKRDSKYKARLGNKKDNYPAKDDSESMRKMKTEMEGRIPIRRPSVVEPTLAKDRIDPFGKQRNSFGLLGNPSNELV